MSSVSAQVVASLDDTMYNTMYILQSCCIQALCWCEASELFVLVRYQQMGNAVCPMVASALGRCLALAAVGEAPESLEQAVVPVPDPDFVQVQHTLTA